MCALSNMRKWETTRTEMLPTLLYNKQISHDEKQIKYTKTQSLKIFESLFKKGYLQNWLILTKKKNILNWC